MTDIEKMESALAWIDELPESVQLYASDDESYYHIAFADQVAELKLLAEDYKRVKNDRKENDD